MRILVLSQYFWPENFRINDLVTELTARGHVVSVLTGVPNYPNGDVYPEYRAAPAAFATFQGTPITRVPMLPRGRGGARLVLNYVTFALGACLLGPWRLRGRPFDVIFVYEPSPVTVGLPGILLRRLKKAPVAFWVQDQWPETLMAVGAIRSAFALSCVGRLVTFIYKRCDLLLAQSRSFIPQIRQYAGACSRVEYFPNWSEQVLNLDSAVAAPEIPRSPETFTVMFAGNIGDAQDFPSILDAANRLKGRNDIRWIIIGDGRRAEWVRGEIRRRGLSERFTLLGRFPSCRMPSFFQCADALLVSLKSEPIFSITVPAKVQSYLAAGRPILAMLDGETADLIRGGGAGMVCSAGDSAGLAQIVARMAELSKADRELMAGRAKQISNTEFDRTMLVDRLEGWLADLTA
jgi:glycosyltransferase involved in cell wall biosynthesis